MIKVETHKSAVSEFCLQHIFQRKRHNVVEVLHLKQEKEQITKQRKRVPLLATDGSYHLQLEQIFMQAHSAIHPFPPHTLLFLGSPKNAAIWSFQEVVSHREETRENKRHRQEFFFDPSLL